MKLDLKLLRFSAAMSSAVLTKGVIVFAAYWLGAKLDKALGTFPLMVALFLVLGVCVGLVWLLYVFKRVKP